MIKNRVQFVLLLIVTNVETKTSFAESDEKPQSRIPASEDFEPEWFGLTPIVNPQANPSSEQQKKYEAVEQNMVLGRQGFWVGLGGMITSVVFDKLRWNVPRTASYAVWGAGWATWIGTLGATHDQLIHGTGSELDHANSESRDRPLLGPSTQGAVGESSNLHLIPNGVYFHPMYNDLNGGTDKLLTASAKVGWLKTFDEADTGLESVAYWRLLTPSFKSQFETDDLPEPVGRFADWAEWKNSISNEMTLMGTVVRNQLSVGYSDIGNKGGREVHQAIHRLTHNSLEHLEYVNQPTGRFFTVAVESGVEDSWCLFPGRCASTLISLQGQQSKVLTELGGQFNAHLVVTPEWWEQALELRVIRQLESQIYGRFKPWRYEAAVGVRVFRHFTPTIKYVSSYLLGDDIGQTYFDLLHYNWQF